MLTKSQNRSIKRVGFKAEKQRLERLIASFKQICEKYPLCREYEDSLLRLRRQLAKLNSRIGK